MPVTESMSLRCCDVHGGPDQTSEEFRRVNDVQAHMGV